MRSETYKGIEFVRISDMPKEQQSLIHQTLDKSKIIKILRDNVLLNDCVLTVDYEAWSVEVRKVEKEPTEAKQAVSELRLVFK